MAKVLEEDPASLNRPFRDYGLFPWDADGWHTPLAYAVPRGNQTIVRLLLECGADARLRPPAGMTLRGIAQEADYRELAPILDEAAEGKKAKSDTDPGG